MRNMVEFFNLFLCHVIDRDIFITPHHPLEPSVINGRPQRLKLFSALQIHFVEL